MRWIAYGQTPIAANTSVTNPQVNKAGVVGEVVLPYTVPPRTTLIIESFGIESYEFQGTVVMFPWLGESPPTNAKALMSVGGGAGTNEILGAEWEIPAGTKVNVHLINGEATPSDPWIYAWYIYGRLEIDN